MGSIAEIEQAITKLSRREFAELEQWFDAQRNREWDRQLEADSASGALDFLLKEVDEDIAQGKTRPLDELLDDGQV
jgi:hypothetical protein